MNIEFKEALKNHDIKVYYQPQYDALTHKMTGAEALARWKKEDQIIMPADFIEGLEESGDILDLDWYMLEECCNFLQKAKDDGLRLFPISVNFSRKHTYEESFIEKLCNIVDRYNVDHNLIIIEVTESALVDHGENVVEKIYKVREKGFKVAIDDFGSGLSSLSFVKDISCDALKIDKSLLSRNCEDEKERILLESIFMFAHRLKLTTVAEGVETREQLEFLRMCDCKIIQGFLFSKPMCEEDYRQLCENYKEKEVVEDILLTQAPSSATQLLLEAVFTRYPLVIFSNLTRNSYYMMAYENFTTQECSSAGVFNELILHGSTTMHPEDQQLFIDTFSIENQMKAYHRGDKYVRVITRQKGDDGIYRRVETSNYFVKNPSVDDVLVISLCHNIDE